MAREWKVVDRFEVDVGQDAAPPVSAAAPPPSGKKWNVVDRVPTAYVLPVANDDAPAELPPLSDPGPRGRVSAPSPHTVPVVTQPEPSTASGLYSAMGSAMSNVPGVNDARARPPVDDTFGDDLVRRGSELLVDPLIRGYRQTAQASNALSAGMGLESPESAAADIAMREKQLRAMPEADFMTRLKERIAGLSQPPVNAMTYGEPEDLLVDGPLGLKTEAGSFAQLAPEYFKDVRIPINVALESGAASLTSIAGGAGGGAAGGAVTGGPIGAAAGMALGAGAGSFLVEYGSDFIDTIRQSGVDMTDQAAILAAFKNPELMALAKEHAIKRGASVAAFDALSGGIAGRVARPVEKAIARTGSLGARVAPLAGEVAEVGAQGFTGGAGEVAGALATGDEVDPNAVIQEIIGELGPGTAEILIGRMQDQKARAKAAEQFEQAADETQLGDVFQGAQDAYARAKAEADARVPPAAPPPAAPADTMAAPPVSGSPSPAPTSKASAPIEATGQGPASAPAPAAAAAPAPEPLTTTPAQPVPSPAAPLAPSAPSVPEPAPAPQSQPGSTTVQEPPASGVATQLPATDTPEFKKWFRKSKMVDDKGAPRVLYHGTSAATDFEAFDRKAGKYKLHPQSINRVGTFFSTSPEHANVFAGRQDGGRVIPVYASIQNPLRFNSQAELIEAWKKHADGNDRLTGGDPEGFRAWLKSEGHDGIVIDAELVDPGLLGRDKPATGDYVITLEPNQVKSSVGNSGKFSKRSPNMLKEQSPTEHMPAPSEKPGSTPTDEAGTLPAEGIDVQEGQIDEAEFAKLFGQPRATAAADTGNRGQTTARPSVPAQPDDADAGRGAVAARERADARNSGRDEREGSGRTADGKPPAVGWREKTAVQGKGGTPRRVWRGSADETSARDFKFESLGHATGKAAAALGVFHTAKQSDAAEYGTARPANLDLRNPITYTPDTLPTFGSKEEAFAHARQLEAQGYDGIILDHSEIGAPDHFIAFHPDQVIHDEGVAEEEAPSTEGIEVQELRDKAEGKTGVEPEGNEPKGRSTEPDDPLRRIAGKAARKIRKQLARSKIPPRAPKRDQTPGRSNFDTMWRHLFSARDPNFVGPKQPEANPESMERREQLVRRIQNKPLAEQLALAKRRMIHYFDFKDIEIDPKMSPREALDVLLDAYNNLHTMANVMTQPRQAMGFNGQLTMQLKLTLGNKGTRGMFSWNFDRGFGESTLALARQADSFTHEWIHALDLGLLMRYFKSRTLGISGLADYTRNPLKALPPRVEAAFTNLLRSMFLVDEAAAQEMARLVMVATAQADQLAKAKAKYERTKDIVDAEHEREARAAEHEKNADATKDPFTAAGLRKAAETLRQTTKKAKAELKTLKAEFEKAKKALAQTQKDTATHLQTKASKFHRGSAYVDQLTGQQYFSLPAEMLARAGEAWMANRIGQQVGVEFLSGSPNFYNENADRMMALVYPDANEREGINQRYDELFAALTEEQYFEGDTVASQIPGDTSFDKELYISALTEPRSAAWKRFLDQRKKDFVHAVMAGKHMVTPSTIAKGGKASVDAMFAWLKSTFWSASGTGQSLISAYKNDADVLPLLRRFYALITTNPGARTEIQGQTAQEEIDHRVREKYAQVDRVMTAHGLDMRDLEQRKALFEEFVRPTEQVHSQIKKHKAFLEDALADMEGDRNKTTEAASIRRYIKRLDGILAKHPIPETPTTPMQKAALALRKISDEMYKRNKDAGIEMGYVSNYMNRTLDRDKIAADRAGFVEQATLAYQMTNLAEHQELQREEKRLEALVKAADAAKKREVRATPEVEGARKKLAEVRAEMVRVTDRNAAEQAEAYLLAIEVPPLFAPQRTTPRTTYTKSRVLGPAADIVLADYYDQNPVQALKHTIATTASRVAYATRFGPGSEKLDAMRKELVAAGLDPRDLATLDDAVQVAFGQTGNFNSAADTAANWALSLGLMKMLVKAGFTNLPEPINAGAITGRTMDGIKALGYAYLPILHGADAREHRLVMELLGLTASSMNEALVANRAGIELGDTPWLTALRAGFGKLSMIHPLTMRGIFGISRVMMDYTNFVATSWATGTAEQKAEALAVFNEFGVPPNQRDEFAKFVRSMPKGMPTSMQLLEAGDYNIKQMYAGVIGRMTRYAMQDPQRVDRARASFGRVGRFVFSITNFPMSYQRDVIFREFKMVREAKRAGATRVRGYGAATAVATRVMWFTAQLTLLTMIAGMAREWWDDRERLKKKKLEDFLSAKAALEAVDRAGRTGMATSMVNYAFKFKFDRELSALAVGAVPGMYLDNATKISKGFAPGRDRNSPNTMLDERKAWGAVYDMTVGLAAQPIAIGLGMTGPGGWAATSKINSRGWRDAFAEKMAAKTPTEKAAAAKAEEKAEMSPEEVEIEAEEREADEADRLELLEMEYGE